MKKSYYVTMIYCLLLVLSFDAWAYSVVDRDRNSGDVNFDVKWEWGFKNDVFEVKVTPGRNFPRSVRNNVLWKAISGTDFFNTQKANCSKMIRPNYVRNGVSLNGVNWMASSYLQRTYMPASIKHSPLAYYTANVNSMTVRFNIAGTVEIGRTYTMQLRGHDYAKMFNIVCGGYWRVYGGFQRSCPAASASAKTVSMLNDALAKVENLEAKVTDLTNQLTKKTEEANKLQTSFKVCTDVKTGLETILKKTKEALAHSNAYAKRVRLFSLRRRAKIKRLRARVKRKRMRIKYLRQVLKQCKK